MIALLQTISMLLNLVWWVFLIMIIMSWLISFNVINTRNQFVASVWRILNQITEPILRPIRRIIPPISGLDLSSGARAGLTAFLKGVSQGVAGSNVTINNILPGSFDTDRLRSGQERSAKQRGVDVSVIREENAAKIPAGRFGTPDEFGAACAWLCSAQAGYITGQNLLIDGGAFPGAF